MSDFEQEADLRAGTLVILRPYDHSKTGSHYPEMIDNMRADGLHIVEIGDGTRIFSLVEVEEKLSQITGPAMLLINAHGSNESIFIEHRLGGFSEGGLGVLFNALTGSIRADSLFKIVPDNFHTVMSTACYSGDGNDEAAKYLPKGTYYLPVTKGAFQNAFYQSNETYFSRTIADGSTPLNPVEFNHSFIMHNKTPSELNEARKADIATENAGQTPGIFFKVNSRNFPTRFAVGGVGVFDLEKTMQNIDLCSISDEQLLNFAGRYEKLVQLDLSKDWDDPALFQMNNLTQQQIIDHMRETIDAVQTDDLDWQHTGFVLAHAFTFDYMQQRGDFAPNSVLELPVSDENLTLMDIKFITTYQ